METSGQPFPPSAAPAGRAEPRASRRPRRATGRLQIGVVGCGYWGPKVLRNMADLENCEVRAVCDPLASRLAPIRRRYPAVEFFPDLDALLGSEIDAVAICTPVRTHHPLAKAALQAGKHVLVEKPMTDSVATSEELVDLAERAGLTLMVDHTFVYSGAVRRIKELIEGGSLGDVLYFDSVRINLGLFQDDVNVLWDLAPHDVSIMDFLLGQEPVWVSAVGSTHFGKLENTVYVTVRFPGPLLAHFHVNWLAPVKIRSTIIGGSERMIVYDDLASSEKVLVYDKGVTIGADPEERHKALIDYRTGDMFAPRLENTEPLREVCGRFVEAATGGPAPPTDGRSGLRVVRVLEAAQRSLERDGDRVELR